MDSWKLVWREGIAPLLSRSSLMALKVALDTDDQRLLQGATTCPPTLQGVQDWPCESACALAYCGWKGEELDTVGEVEEFFARMCYASDQRTGDGGDIRFFLNWFDEAPRHEVFRLLLPEVKIALATLEEKEAVAC